MTSPGSEIPGAANREGAETMKPFADFSGLRLRDFHRANPMSIALAPAPMRG